MIINVVFVSSSHTEGVRPKNGSLYDISVACPPKTGKDGNTLILTISPQLRYIDFYSKKEYLVYYSEIKYHVFTDGTLTANELYTVFEKGMKLCINTYQIAHQHLESRGDKMFEPIPFDALEDYLQQIVDWFLEK